MKIQKRKDSRIGPRGHSLLERLEPRTLFSANLTVDSGLEIQPTFVQLFNPYSSISSFVPTDFSTWHDGVLWTTHGDTITRRDLAGQTSTLQVPTAINTSNGATAHRPITSNIVFAHDNTAWFVINDNSQSRLEGLTAADQFVDESDRQADSIWHLTAGTDGSLWYTQGVNAIGHIVNGQTTVVTIPQAQGFSGLTSASDGSIWFTGDTVRPAGDFMVRAGIAGHIKADGTLSVFTFGDLPSNPVQGSDGNLYFGGVDAIHRLSPDGVETRINLPGVTAVSLIAAADGAIWFIDRRNTLNPIARLAADGTVQHMAPAGAAGMRIESLTFAPDGALWALDSQGVSTRINVSAGLFGQGTQINAPAYKQEWQFIVGSITDATAPGNASDYSATVDWGDGTVSAATLVPNASGGFDVVGTHAFTAWAWRVVSVHVTDLRHLADPAAADRSVDFHSAAYVVPPGMAASGLTITPTAGETFSGAVAVLTGVDVDALDQYDVTIQWGNQSAPFQWGDTDTTQGTLVAGENGEVRVMGTHVYLHDGAQALTIRITQKTTAPPGNWSAPANSFYPTGQLVSSFVVMSEGIFYPGTSNSLQEVAMGRAEVARGPMDGVPNSLSGVEGIVSTGALGHFTYAGSADDLSHLHVQIDTGDGRTVAGTITAVDNGFEVYGSLVYASAGTYGVSVRITDDRLADQTVGMTRFFFSTANHLSLDVNPITGTAGQEFNGVVAAIHDNGFANWSSTFNTMINWGDGTTSAGTITDAGNGLLYVSGTHTYAAVPFGSLHSLQVNVSETRAPLDPSFPTPDHAYTAAASSITFWISAAPVTEFTVHHLGQFNRDAQTGVAGDLALAGMALPIGMSPDDVTGSVVWDDGQTTAVRITPSPDGYANYQNRLYPWSFDYLVLTTATFAAAGSHHGVLTLTSATKTETFDVNQQVYTPFVPIVIPPPPVVYIGHIDALDFSTYKHQSTTVTVAHFQPDPLKPFDPATASITIYWGDGGESPGTLVANDAGSYDIIGTHTYDTSGVFSRQHFSVSITTPDGNTGDSADASVSIDPTRVDVEPLDTIDYRQRETFTATLAKFTAPTGGNFTPEDFSATIAWGDGTTSAGVITRDLDGKFEVAGTHKYQVDGYENWSVTVTGPGGPDSSHGTVHLLHNSVVITPASDVTLDDDGTVHGTFAHFIDEDPVPYNSDVLYVALIDWGDGQTSNGLVVPNTSGGYDVQASHKYASDGDFALTLIVRRNVRDLPGLSSESISDFTSQPWIQPGAWDGTLGSVIAAGIGSVTSLNMVSTYLTQTDTDARGSLGTFHIYHNVSTGWTAGAGDGSGARLIDDSNGNVGTPPPPPPPSARLTVIARAATPSALSVATRASEIAGVSVAVGAIAGISSGTESGQTGGADVNHALPAETADIQSEVPHNPTDPAKFEGEFRMNDGDAPPPSAPEPQDETAPATPDDGGNLLEDSVSQGDGVRGNAVSAVLGTAVSGPRFLVVNHPDDRDGWKNAAAEARVDVGTLLHGPWWKVLAFAGSLVGLQLHRRRRAMGSGGRAEASGRN